MTIKLVITNPNQHAPYELRAAALFLNTLAAERESVKVSSPTGSTIPLGNFEVQVELEESEVKSFSDKFSAQDVTVVGEYADERTVNMLSGEEPADVFGGDAKPSDQTGSTTPVSDAPTQEGASDPAAGSTASPSSDVAPGVQVDKAGLPWDARIHASSKAINQGDGLWRAKRGRDEMLVPGVEAELRALMAVKAPAPADDTPPPIPEDDDLPPPVPDEDGDTPPPIPDEDSGVPKNLGELMQLATAAVAAKRLEMVELTNAAKELGVAGLPLLGARPDLVAAVYDKLKDKLS